MLGSIIGDIVGSRHESSPKYPKKPVKNKNFRLFTPECRFTDDTVLTCATAQALLTNDPNYEEYYLSWGLKYPDRGYGSGFKKWLVEPLITVNNSYANGCMMRCSPIGFYYKEYPLNVALTEAHFSINYTHNSPESRRGVQSIVSAVHMAVNGKSKEEIKDHVQEYYGHMLNLSLNELRKQPKTTIRCNFTAPQALTAFMESTDFESAIRNAVYIGGDTDTNAAIAGAIAEAYYKKIPLEFINEVYKRLPEEMIVLIDKFYTAAKIETNKI